MARTIIPALSPLAKAARGWPSSPNVKPTVPVKNTLDCLVPFDFTFQDKLLGNHGLLENATNSGIDLITTKDGKAAYFDGSSHIVLGKDSGPYFARQPICFSFLISTTTSSGGYLLGSFDDGTDKGFQLGVNYGNTGGSQAGGIYFYLREDGGAESIQFGLTSGISALYDGNLHHILVYLEGYSKRAIYFDGVSQSISVNTFGAPATFDSFQYDLLLGARNNRGTIENHYTGNIHAFSMFNRAPRPNDFGEYWSNYVPANDTTYFIGAAAASAPSYQETISQSVSSSAATLEAVDYSETLAQSVTASQSFVEAIDFSELLAQSVTSSQAMAETYEQAGAPTLSAPIYNTVGTNSATLGCTVTF